MQLQTETCCRIDLHPYPLEIESCAHRLSLSVMSSASDLQSVKEDDLRVPLCPFVARWFTVSQFAVKIIEVLLGITAVVLVFLWHSEGVSILDPSMSEGSYSFRNRFIGYVAVACISVLYSVVMTTLGMGGLNIPPSLRTFLAGCMLATWMLISSIASATIEELNHTPFARAKGLNTLYLEVSTALGFISMVVFVLDVLLAFLGLRALSDSKDFAGEVERSKSVMLAVKSGRSLAELQCRSRQMSRVASYRSRQDSCYDDPMSEISPLRSHEDMPTDTYYTV